MNKRHRFLHTTAMLATSLAAFGPGAAAREMKEGKKERPTTLSPRTARPPALSGTPPPSASEPIKPQPLESALTSSLGSASPTVQLRPAPGAAAFSALMPDVQGLKAGRYPWHMNIVTTTFWIGEDAAPNNPVANYASSWDPTWSRSYGGLDTPIRAQRADFQPAGFIPQQNPFYIALPYNDVSKGAQKPEAASIIPWFKEAFREPGKTVLKGRWVAIHFNGRIAYGQWEDCGPFRTDHSNYVFGTERPKPNLNKGAGLDVSPAVRDYLAMGDTDVTDWRFVEFNEVPRGPWSLHGSNNTFVMQDQAKDQPVVLLQQMQPAGK